ncbi:MAG TPA: ATP synthase F0 subunit A [Flavobacteriales bacterium]|nr:ATP synthase F0 subunit A [Flavobacteriales bacterium]|tara:strand:+ start:6184 stop:7299 length:1116 start_codon:yes stop_codon:yes gene_type:complete
MKNFRIAYLLILSVFMFASVGTKANDEEHGVKEKVHEVVEHIEEAEERFNPVPVIMHHVTDAHEWHLWGEGEHSVTIPLPVILWTDKGLVTFMSSAFHHDDNGHHVVEKNGMRFVKVHEKIYQLNEGETAAKFNEEHLIENGFKQLDFSITKNVAAMLIAAILLLFIFGKMGSYYKNNGPVAPKGIASFLEPVVVFVRDEIALVNIGEKKHAKFLPYLLTVFFFIWIGNLLGLLPGGANLTGNIAVTLTLSVFTMLIVNLNGNKDYWGHIFWMPGAPVPVKFILAPIELVGIFAKPFALMVRLFANITAGHIVILSLISLIFIFKSVAMGAVSVPFALFISVLELLVAFLQAFIFTMLSALFIGMAVQEHH